VACAASLIGAGAFSAIAPSQGAAAASTPNYYLSLGDSYAMGYQPGFPSGSETLHGFANRVAASVGRHKLTLENFGCGGATTTSILHSVGCSGEALDGVPYPSATQEAAALGFIAAHRGRIGLITISIGGNDFDGCIGAAPTCVTDAMPEMRSNIETLSAALRSAVGAHVPIIAITYPDVVLGAWVHGSATHALVEQSLQAFKQTINPTFEAAYAPSHVTFVDVTAATGAYVPLTTLVTHRPYGRIPYAVSRVCTLTWFCQQENIHPKNAGYAEIAALITSAYRQLTS
jgi:lysophospholipase L1-like esterase